MFALAIRIRNFFKIRGKAEIWAFIMMESEVCKI